MIEVRDLHFSYDNAPLLRGVDLCVEAGQNAFLLGPSGSGKSTILRCIAGLETNFSGIIKSNQRDLVGLAPHRRRVGMLFQEPALFPHLNVWQNVAFGLRYRGIARQARRAEAESWLEIVGLQRHAERSVEELSGGERQRVCLARSLAAKPDAILLDEPFSALDRRLRDDLGDRVKAILAEQGVPALWVTHDEGEADRLGDVVWRLLDGRLQLA